MWFTLQINMLLQRSLILMCFGLHSVTKKKWSVAEARPADSGSRRLTKQESAGRFIGSYARDIPVWSLEFQQFPLLFSHSSKNRWNNSKLTPLIDTTWRNIRNFFQNFLFISRSREEWGFKSKNVIRKCLICTERDQRSPPQRNSTKIDSIVGST